MAEDAKKQLVDLLDSKVFDPIMNAKESDYHDAHKKKELQDVQGATKSTKNRYHTHYHSASDVKTNYQRDLDSDSAQKVDKELKDLGLPTLRDVKPQFEQLARKLGV